jgi:hypothetical protein
MIMTEQLRALVQRFEHANDEASRVVGCCVKEHWLAYHTAENRTVNVLAHHIAVGH